MTVRKQGKTSRLLKPFPEFRSEEKRLETVLTTHPSKEAALRASVQEFATGQRLSSTCRPGQLELKASPH